MKKIILEVEFNDTDGYKYDTFGKDDTSELIVLLLENEMKYVLESDKVIKKGWSVKLIK